jgi:metal-responsive CopG/Arc/MetJ family transcriptional regulator
MAKQGSPRSAQLGVRLENELLRRVDAIVEKFTPTVLRVSRSEIVRSCIEKGIGAVEEETDRMIRAAAAKKPTK